MFLTFCTNVSFFPPLSLLNDWLPLLISAWQGARVGTDTYNDVQPFPLPLQRTILAIFRLLFPRGSFRKLQTERLTRIFLKDPKKQRCIPWNQTLLAWPNLSPICSKCWWLLSVVASFIQPEFQGPEWIVYVRYQIQCLHLKAKEVERVVPVCRNKGRAGDGRRRISTTGW